MKSFLFDKYTINACSEMKTKYTLEKRHTLEIMNKFLNLRRI